MYLVRPVLRVVFGILIRFCERWSHSHFRYDCLKSQRWCVYNWL